MVINNQEGKVDSPRYSKVQRIHPSRTRLPARFSSCASSIVLFVVVCRRVFFTVTIALLISNTYCEALAPTHQQDIDKYFLGAIC